MYHLKNKTSDGNVLLRTIITWAMPIFLRAIHTGIQLLSGQHITNQIEIILEKSLENN